jgi:hypothetical protein
LHACNRYWRLCSEHSLRARINIHRNNSRDTVANGEPIPKCSDSDLESLRVQCTRDLSYRIFQVLHAPF